MGLLDRATHDRTDQGRGPGNDTLTHASNLIGNEDSELGLQYSHCPRGQSGKQRSKTGTSFSLKT